MTIELRGALFFGSTERVLQHFDPPPPTPTRSPRLRRVHEAGPPPAGSSWSCRLDRRRGSVRLRPHSPSGPLAALHAACRALATCPGLFRACDQGARMGGTAQTPTSAGATGQVRHRQPRPSGPREQIRLTASPALCLEGPDHRPRATRRNSSRVARSTVSRSFAWRGRRERVVRIARSARPSARWPSSTAAAPADVVADKQVICYGFSVEALKASGLSAGIMTTILGNMMFLGGSAANDECGRWSSSARSLG